MFHTSSLRRSLFGTIALIALIAAACGSSDDANDSISSDTGDSVSADEPDLDDPATADEAAERAAPTLVRVGEIQQAINAWANAGTIEDAHGAAELAANLIVGLNGPRFGDRDDNGTIEGSEPPGLLSGRDDTPEGLAAELASNDCVANDVLGAAASDVNAAWDEMLEAIDAWSPTNNTMPTLSSHPMRIVGWATFTLATNDLAEAHEYAGHAQLHIDVTSQAVTCA